MFDNRGSRNAYDRGSRGSDKRGKRDRERSRSQEKERDRGYSRKRPADHHEDDYHEQDMDRDRGHASKRKRSHSRTRSRSRSRSRTRINKRYNRSRSPRRRRRSRSPNRKSNSKGGAVPKYLLERPEITDKDLEGKTEEEQEMMKMMGFGSFDTTKGGHVRGNDVYAVHVIQKRKYRQYMNRKGGFNRPLDFVA